MIRAKVASSLRTTATYIEVDYIQYANWLWASAKKTWADAKVLCKREFDSYKHMGSHAFELRDVEAEFLNGKDGAQILKDRTWKYQN